MAELPELAVDIVSTVLGGVGRPYRKYSSGDREHHLHVSLQIGIGSRMAEQFL